MKKAIAFLLPLALLISAVSCSQNSNTSETSQAGSSVSSENNASNASDGTNYTKGTLQDNAYVNEYAGIKMNIPDGLRMATDKELTDLTGSSVTYYTDEKNSAFEAGTIWDSWVTNENTIANVFFRFINTKVAFPGKSDVTTDDVLDIFKERNMGSDAKYEERTTVTLCGQEYTREVYSFAAAEFSPPYFNYLYARKLDNDLVCLITISTNKSENTSDYFEGFFE